jgi:hypothetical protein
MDRTDLIRLLTAELGGVLAAEDFDVTAGPAEGELAVDADDWTLHLEGRPAGIAWLAIDDEPDSPADYRTARRAVMDETVERALAAVDRQAGGALTRALIASGDPFTRDFAAALAEIQAGTAS